MVANTSQGIQNKRGKGSVEETLATAHHAVSEPQTSANT